MVILGMSVVWLIAFIVFLVLEAITTGALVSVWFSLGALAAMAAAKCELQFVTQFTIFVVTSLALLILTKPFVKKIRPKSEATNLDAIIGMIGIVTEDIDNIVEKGSLKVDGKLWSARSIDDTVIEKDIRVKIVSIKGVKAFVERA